MLQAIYKTIENKFRSFVKNNRQIFEDMEYGEILKVSNPITIPNGRTLCSTDMLESPFYVAYFGKLKGGEGDFYIFLDEKMNKIYSHYDVE